MKGSCRIKIIKYKQKEGKLPGLDCNEIRFTAFPHSCASEFKLNL